MHLFPAIDLIDGHVVRLHQGDYDQQTTYSDDPVEHARKFDDAGSTYLHLVDLDGARTGEPVHLSVIKKICDQTNLKVEVGGGIRSEDTIKKLLDAGVSRIVLGTAALQQWDWFEDLALNSSFGSNLVLGLDARKGKLAVAGWKTQIEATAIEVAQRVDGWPLAGIVFTDIATDGTLKGPNVESTREIAEATSVPVVASGGVGNLDHLRVLRELPLQGAIVGRALYDGAFTIDEALVALEG